MVKRDTFLKKLDDKLKELEEQFLNEKANEAIEARDAIVKVLKEHEISLPAAVFALEIVKWELLKGEYEEFVNQGKPTAEAGKPHGLEKDSLRR